MVTISMMFRYASEMVTAWRAILAATCTAACCLLVNMRHLASGVRPSHTRLTLYLHGIAAQRCDMHTSCIGAHQRATSWGTSQRGRLRQPWYHGNRERTCTTPCIWYCTQSQACKAAMMRSRPISRVRSCGEALAPAKACSSASWQCGSSSSTPVTTSRSGAAATPATTAVRALCGSAAPRWLPTLHASQIWLPLAAWKSDPVLLLALLLTCSRWPQAL